MKKIDLKRALVWIVLVIDLILCLSIWYKAVWWENMVTSDEKSWYGEPIISRLELQGAYDRAFEKIILINLLLVVPAIFLYTTKKK